MNDFLLGLPGKIKTLVDRLTATRAANLDNLNATVSSRAAASTALSNATWTNALAAQILANLDQPVSTPSSPIKSIQSGLVAFPSGSTSATANIAAVDQTKAVLFFSQSLANAYGSNPARGKITSSTQLTFSRGGATSSSHAIEWQIVEYS